MSSKDLHHSLDVVQSIKPGTYKTAQTGAAVDLQGFFGAEVVIDVGTWTDGSHVFEVQESDAAGSGFAAVADADLLGTEPTVGGATADEQIYRLGYMGTKRYIKVVSTGSGSTGCAYTASVIRGEPRKSPTN